MPDIDPITRLAAEAGQRLAARGLQVTTAESCTGGGIAEAITRISGASTWFEAGFVTYSSRHKSRQLGVPAELLARHGAVSAAVVEAMALGARERAAADLAIAVSGLAGPGGGTPELPVGTVWLAWADAARCVSRCFLFEGDRDAVRKQAIEQALRGLLTLLDDR